MTDCTASATDDAVYDGIRDLTNKGKPNVPGKSKLVLIEVAAGTYPAGGIELAVDGFDYISHISAMGLDANAYTANWDDTAQKLRLIAHAAHIHAVGAGDSHTHTDDFANAASDVTPQAIPFDEAGVTLPAIALVHNADPVSNLAASPIYIKTVTPQSKLSMGALESDTDANASTAFTTSNDGGIYVANVRASGWVTHSVSPAGVLLGVDMRAGGTQYSLCATFVNGLDHYLPMILSGQPMYVKVAHNADVGAIITADPLTHADYRGLFVDDNGADNAKLVGAFGSTRALLASTKLKGILAAGITGVNSSRIGEAAAQAISGGVIAETVHTHGNTVSGTGAAEVATGATISSAIYFLAQVFGPRNDR